MCKRSTPCIVDARPWRRRLADDKQASSPRGRRPIGVPMLNYRVALRLDGESGELWLPQSLLDILVGSVDPALSLDRLGPDRAAIILEFALDSVLAAVEMNLGCKLAVDSFSGQVERLENDGQLPLFFTLVIEGLVTTGCELRISPDYALRLAEGLDRHAGISPPVLDLPIPVCLRVAAANLAAAEIERLSPDDVVLVDASCEPGDAVIAVIGERLVAPVTLAPGGPPPCHASDTGSHFILGMEHADRCHGRRVGGGRRNRQPVAACPVRDRTLRAAGQPGEAARAELPVAVGATARPDGRYRGRRTADRPWHLDADRQSHGCPGHCTTRTPARRCRLEIRAPAGERPRFE